MKRTGRWRSAVLAVLALLPWSLQAREPLAGQVSIYRDEYGVTAHCGRDGGTHVNDMVRLHSQRKMKQLWLTPEDILAHTESVWGDKERLRKCARSIT